MIKCLEIEKLSNNIYSIIFENIEEVLKEIRKYKVNTCNSDTYKCYVYDENINLIELFVFKQDLNLTYDNESYFPRSNFIKYSSENVPNCLKIRYIPCTSLNVRVIDINENVGETLEELRKYKTDIYCTAREECYVYDSNSNLVEFFILKKDSPVLDPILRNKDSKQDTELPPLPKNINIII